MVNNSISKYQVALNIINELSSKDKMDVKLHTNSEKKLKRLPEFELPRSRPVLICFIYKIYFVGIIQIGSRFLDVLDYDGLKGILAHELAHLKKQHVMINLSLIFSVIIVFLLMLIFGVILELCSIITLLIGILIIITLIFRLIRIQSPQEYEADAIAADYVGEKLMTHALKQAARYIDRPNDTWNHPSFKKRIARLEATRKLKEENQKIG